MCTTKMNTQKYQKPTVFSGYPEPLECDSERTRLVAGMRSALLIKENSNLDSCIKIIEESLRLKKI